MKKQPNRSTAQDMSISQRFNDGKIAISAYFDDAEPGYQPVKRISTKGFLPFEEQRIGVTRFYQAKQAQQNVNKVIRVPKPSYDINVFDVVEIYDDNRLYRVEMVQKVNDVFPKSLDLTLSVVEQGAF